MGIIGASRDGAISATTVANTIVGCNAFSGVGKDHEGDAPDDNQLEAHYDSDRCTLFFNMVCSYEDIVDLASQAEIGVDDISTEMSHAWLEQQDDQIMQKIAFLFASCHEIVLVMPSRQLEPHWIKLFKLLESARKFIKQSAPTLTSSGFNTSRHSSEAGGGSGKLLPKPGYCIPRLRFVVQAPASSGAKVSKQRGAGGWGGGQSVVVPLSNERVKHLRHALETQFRRVLRVGQLGSCKPSEQNKLFSLPSTHMVFVHEPSTVIAKGQALLRDAEDDKASFLLEMFGTNFFDPLTASSSSGGGGSVGGASTPVPLSPPPSSSPPPSPLWTSIPLFRRQWH